MLYRVLGPLETRLGDRWTTISAPKWRVLLGLLLLSPGRTVPVDVLVDELWPDDPPRGARKLVSGYVSRLRRIIDDPACRVLITRPQGYLLAVCATEVDAGQFDELVQAARGAWRERRPEETAALLAEGLVLWRGLALADVPGGPLIRAERARLEELRLSAAELRAEAEVACGRHAEAVAELRQLAAEHPWRERMHALLMLALYRSGRQGEALAAYQQAEALLVTELGVTPGPELRDLRQQILTRDRRLAGNPVALPLVNTADRLGGAAGQGGLTEAIDHLQQAMAICRDLAEAQARAGAAGGSGAAQDAGRPGQMPTALQAVR